MTKDNNLLCKFHLDEMPPAPRGASQIEVTFDMDTNESLNVSAQDRSTGRSNQITMTSEKEHLSPTETDHLVQEPEVYRDEEEVNKTNVEAKNGLKNHCVTMRSTSIVEKLKSKFEVGYKAKTEEAVQKAQNCLDENQWAEKSEFEAKQKRLQDPQNAEDSATGSHHSKRAENGRSTEGAIHW